MFASARTLIFSVLAGVVITIPAIAFAEGEHARRAGAELLVLLGDVKKLDREDVPEKQKNGLRDRIEGSISGLPLLLRLADQEKARIMPAPDFDAWYRSVNERTFLPLIQQISLLTGEYPFHATGILPAVSSAERINNALAMHKSLCAGCHDYPYLDTERPAFNLFDMSRRFPAREFAARMVVGIRGDIMTGLDNPFTDEEIAALIALYQQNTNAVITE